MIGKLNHIAIAVPNIEEAAAQYKNVFGATVSEAVEQPDHGVTTVFIDLGNTKIELLEVLGDDSPIQSLLIKIQKVACIIFVLRFKILMKQLSSLILMR